MTALPPPGPAPGSMLLLRGRVLDLTAGVLRDGDGAPIALRPQAWAVLCVLARHAGSVVTKDQLLDAVWPGLVVTDSSLARAVSDLRAALGSSVGHEIIKTVARRGYRLLAAEPTANATLPPASGPLAAARGPLSVASPNSRQCTSCWRGIGSSLFVGAGGVGKTALAVAAARWHATGRPRWQPGSTWRSWRTRMCSLPRLRERSDCR